MKKLFFILVCASICAFGCNQKTTPQDNQVQEEVELTDIERCQSCGMPLADGLYGTNADGTPNSEYCMYCYANGQFTAPDITMEEMIEICVPFMVEQGMAEDEARNVLQEYMPCLKRWQASPL